jgi:two-component system, response regulator
MDNKKHILLIEDSPDDELLTRRAFGKHNFNNIRVAHDGNEAIRFLHQNPEDETDVPDLILLDLNLPGTDGIHVLKQLRSNQKTRHTPVIVLTSSVEEYDITNSYRNGANSYVRKPVDFVEFEQLANHIGNYWLRYNQPPPRRVPEI